jgi:hypothetical protein
MVAVQVDEINCEAHSDRVDGLARNDPHAFSGSEELMAQESLAAFAGIISYINLVCQLELPSHIRNANGPSLQSGPSIRNPTQYSFHNNHRCA